ncbi:hypothetical protein F4809DRAFT_328064 [Biscogniauxia mediterranea]|nr:hypothetical protein F4809DRAFT_328064 [Biscogniauxia mediterranea]
MATDTLPSSLSFLTDAAHLLATTAPETSAHLMSQRNSLMFENNLHLPDVQRQHVCGCCGHIMIIGQGDVLKLEAGRALRKKKNLAKGSVKRDVSKDVPRRGGRKIITCGMCSRYTKIDLPPPATPVPRGRHKKKQQQKQQQVSQPMVTIDTPLSSIHSHSNSPASSAPEVPPTNAKTSANANSKKRAKSRKQGLQALLQQSASSKPQLGFGLSMTDFMKK